MVVGKTCAPCLTIQGRFCMAMLKEPERKFLKNQGPPVKSELKVKAGHNVRRQMHVKIHDFQQSSIC